MKKKIISNAARHVSIEMDTQSITTCHVEMNVYIRHMLNTIMNVTTNASQERFHAKAPVRQEIFFVRVLATQKKKQTHAQLQ